MSFKTLAAQTRSGPPNFYRRLYFRSPLQHLHQHRGPKLSWLVGRWHLSVTLIRVYIGFLWIHVCPPSNVLLKRVFGKFVTLLAQTYYFTREIPT